MKGTPGAVTKLAIRVDWFERSSMTVPPPLLMMIAPSNTVQMLSSAPSLMWHAAFVPRMPMVATGVLMVMFSGWVAAIWPEEKTKAPCRAENTKLPS